jgi:taurine dioxygenase
MSIEVLPSEFEVGAQIKGVDLSLPQSREALAAIDEALCKHQVLLFRGPKLPPQVFADFSAQFGKARQHIQAAFRHPTVPDIVYNRNVDEKGNFDAAGASRGVTKTLREGWHSDATYENPPAKATVVHALEIPSHGGNTCFASSYRAYETLPSEFKARVAGLKAEFALGRNKRNEQTKALTAKLPKSAKEEPAVVHPVICRHPETHQPAIFVNPLITVRILDIDATESEDILQTLFDHIDAAGSSAEHWEHQWQVGDTLMWDNRGGLMHSGRMDYPLEERRIMYRSTIGASPIEAFAVTA